MHQDVIGDPAFEVGSIIADMGAPLVEAGAGEVGVAIDGERDSPALENLAVGGCA
jgi:hypothetical protein